MMHKRKLTVGSVVGTIILGGLILALLIFTASRTVHFLQLTFPPDFAYVAYLALAAFDGGIIGWSIFATVSAEGAMQRGLAYLMIFVCLVGVILTTVADTIISSGQNGLTKVPPYMATIGVWGSLVVIILNVVAGVVAHLASPHHVRKFQLESIHDEIHQLTIQHIRASALDIAPKIAAESADHWVRMTVQDAVGSLPMPKQQTLLPGPKIIDADKSKLVYASNEHSTGKVDPYNVRQQVEEDKKIERQPLSRTLKEAISFKLPANVTKKIETEAEELPVEEIEEEEEDAESPSTWTDEEWAAVYEKIDAFAFNDLWKLYKGDAPYPWEKEIPVKKKRSSKKKTANQGE